MQNYLVWRLVQDRISSLSQRFKDTRAKYRKVCKTSPGPEPRCHSFSPLMILSPCKGGGR